jgi:hypothetical protein
MDDYREGRRAIRARDEARNDRDKAERENARLRGAVEALLSDDALRRGLAALMVTDAPGNREALRRALEGQS